MGAASGSSTCGSLDGQAGCETRTRGTVKENSLGEWGRARVSGAHDDGVAGSGPKTFPTRGGNAGSASVKH